MAEGIYKGSWNGICLLAVQSPLKEWYTSLILSYNAWQVIADVWWFCRPPRTCVCLWLLEVFYRFHMRLYNICMICITAIYPWVSSELMYSVCQETLVIDHPHPHPPPRCQMLVYYYKGISMKILADPLPEYCDRMGYHKNVPAVWYLCETAL